MELQEIDVFIEKDGQVKLEVRGVKGTTCLDLTKELETILGGEVISREMTILNSDEPENFLEIYS